MPLEEWQNLRIDPTVLAPDLMSPSAVVLFRIVRNSKFIQSAGKGLIGIHMIRIPIVAFPIKLEALKGLQVAGVVGNHRFQKEVVVQVFSDFAINDERIADLVYI